MLSRSCNVTLVLIAGWFLWPGLGASGLYAQDTACKIEIVSNPRLPIEPGKEIAIDTSGLTNLLRNATFQDATGWGLNDRGRGTVSLDETVFHSAPYSVKVAKPANPQYSDVSQGLGLEPETTYYVECYARAEISEGRSRKGAKLYVSLLRREEGKAGRAVYITLQTLKVTTNDWVKLAGVFQTPSGTKSGQLWGLFDRTGVAWFDDFLLCPLSATLTVTVACPDIKQVRLLNEDEEVLDDSGILAKGTDRCKRTKAGLALDEFYTVDVATHGGEVFRREYPE